VLEEVRKRYEFVVVGYVVMPEHIHLLMSKPQKKNPSTVMQTFKLGFARRVIAEAERHSESTPPTSRKTREVAYPQLVRVNRQRQPALSALNVAHPASAGVAACAGDVTQ
jgi:hypothetical protein